MRSVHRVNNIHEPEWPDAVRQTPLRRNWLRRSLLALLACLLATPADACQIPVFRYALERWQPDPYEAVIVHRGELTDEQKQLVAQLQDIQHDEKTPLNLVTKTIDLDKATEEDLATLHGDYPTDQLPKLFVNYPYYYPVKRSAWEGKLTPENVKGVIDSPMRKEVVKRLLDGESAIWILIECGNKTKDEAAAKLIAEQLKINQKELKLPEQDTLENDEFFQEETAVKLRLAFSLIRVSRKDAAEAVFLDTLLNSEDEMPANEPIAIPVFGRGRSYFAVVGQGINEETMGSDCRFLTGPCSCRVKLENPGVDLLFAVDWDRNITTSTFREIELPELAGISNVVAAAQSDPNRGPDDIGVSPIKIVPPASETTADDSAAGGSNTPKDTAAANDDGKQTATAADGSRTAKPAATGGTADPAQSADSISPKAVAEFSIISLWVPILGVVILGALVVAIGSTMLKRRPD
ncbi:MAG: hypothetical protein VX988_03985 [Planctomycetota bacterium]|nr:hypothetical protein [Planctomycetota bacterium]